METVKNLILQQFTGISIGVIGILIGFLVFYITRKTKTKKDDEIVDQFIEPAFATAFKMIPENCNINWLKLVKNMLGAFITEYTKQKQIPPTASEYERFKQLAIDYAKYKGNISVKK